MGGPGPAPPAEHDVVGRYLELGLRLGRHLDGLVDAYYGPPEVAARVAAEPPSPLGELAAEARRLVADLDAGPGQLEPGRRRWLRVQVVGLVTVADKLGGAEVPYVEEVEACYGVTPTWVPEEEVGAAHRRLDEALPGSGPLAERYGAWREAHAVPVERLPGLLASLSEELRERTATAIGLPEGERVSFELVRERLWSGFNHYLGGLRSRVEINTDLPVLSLSLPHLVAHEAYPGHHTEHCRKEVGLVRRRRQLEESIFLVGTPQCTVAEGLADLALEALVPEPERALAHHFRAAGVRYDAEVAAAVRGAGEALAAVRGNVGLLLHARGAPPEEAVAYAERWALLPRARAEKAVAFQTDPTWRAYISCYVEGLPLCRRFLAGRPDRFTRLVTEQLTPDELRAAA